MFSVTHNGLANRITRGIFFDIGCPEDDDLPDMLLFGWVGCIIKFSSR